MAHDIGMAKTYLSLTQFAKRIGITSGALGNLNLPAPDVIIDNGSRQTRGWSEKTIDTWNASRPGSGNWGREGKTKEAKMRRAKSEQK